MYQFSDSDSVDSDEGIRYKTASIRNKNKWSDTDSPSSKNDTRRRRERSRSRSPRYREHKERPLEIKKQKKEHLRQDDFNRKDSRRISGRSKARDDEDRDARRKEKERKRKLPSESSGSSRKEHSTGQLLMKTNAYCKEPSAKEKNVSVAFGPVLPPKKHNSTEICSELVDLTDESQSIGPVLPACIDKVIFDENAQTEESKSINSLLPPHFVTVSSLEDDSSDEKFETIGPDLPSNLREINSYVEPNLLTNAEQGEGALKQNSIAGPAVPPNLLKKDSVEEVYGPTPPEKPVDITIGPAIPTHLRQKLLEESSDLSVELIDEEQISEDEEVFGPIPVGENYSKAHIELEERALKMKMDQLEPAEDKQPGREEWMLTLPAAKAASFGLGPRQFRAKAGPDLSDRSSWTDTPEDKAQKKAGKVEPKVDLKKEAELKEIRRRDKEQEAIAKKNKKHKESLLDMHVKKIKKDKKNESESSERRPFSREIDLQVNRFDEAQKKAVLKKAQLLDTRFSAGESKFL